ncbi:VTT domain-containing protein [Methanococcoides sp. NM1]|uniref:VTT domain-containing protein n=1 Tax=Methanococcoides sp. NM1 TaxID=1201013 RepID=UPI001FCE5AD9|nr:VTT domain-containing protein [Methanococcoides sp. NM1]
MKIKNEKLIPSKTDTNEMGICPHHDGKKNIQILGLIVLFIASWSILLFYHPPGEIVERLGVRNIYIFVFLLAMIGGVSTFTSTTFYAALITISLGGVNPIWIALFASIGLTFGDLVFYYLGTKGRQCIKGKYAGNVFRLTKWMEKIDDRITMLMIFFYSLTPLPSDIIAISLAIVGFPFRKMLIPLFVGNFTLIIMLVELSKLGYSLI